MPTDRRDANPSFLRPATALAALALLGAPAAPSTATALHAQVLRQVVLTFDDVPMTGTCGEGDIRKITAGLTNVLERRGLPSAVLVTPLACVSGALLRETLSRWREVDATIGNHTYTHPDINGTPLPAYLDGIRTAQERIDQAVPTEARWFRPPYLHTGDDPQKKESLAAYLAEEGYRMAPVTVDNQEWVYAGVYEAAHATGDRALAARALEGYLGHLEASMAFYEELSRAVFAREIPQVLLLHANRLNADHLDQVVDLLEARGYEFVSLEAGTTDAAYQREDPYVGPRGLSWIQRWAVADGVEVPPEPREDPWAAAALERAQAGSDGATGADASTAACPAATVAPPADSLIARARRFRALLRTGDYEAARAMASSDPRRWWEEREGEGSAWTIGPARGPWAGWDEEFNSRGEVVDWRSRSRSATARVCETNDYYELLERGSVTNEVTYFFDAEGKIDGLLIRASGERPPGATDEFLDWAKANASAELAELMPGGEIDPSGDHPARFRALLERWNRQRTVADQPK